MYSKRFSFTQTQAYRLRLKLLVECWIGLNLYANECDNIIEFGSNEMEHDNDNDVRGKRPRGNISKLIKSMKNGSQRHREWLWRCQWHIYNSTYKPAYCRYDERMMSSCVVRREKSTQTTLSNDEDSRQLPSVLRCIWQHIMECICYVWIVFMRIITLECSNSGNKPTATRAIHFLFLSPISSWTCRRVYVSVWRHSLTKWKDTLHQLLSPFTIHHFHQVDVG